MTSHYTPVTPNTCNLQYFPAHLRYKFPQTLSTTYTLQEPQCPSTPHYTPKHHHFINTTHHNSQHHDCLEINRSSTPTTQTLTTKHNSPSCVTRQQLLKPSRHKALTLNPRTTLSHQQHRMIPQTSTGITNSPHLYCKDSTPSPLTV